MAKPDRISASQGVTSLLGAHGFFSIANGPWALGAAIADE